MNWEVWTMKSKTSFFNSALLRKNTIRFSPIWIAYLAIWIIAMPLLLAMQLFNQPEMWRPEWADVAQAVGGMMTGAGPVFACIYGLVVAMAVFSYLYTARSVSLLHALPIRRSGLFLTNYISGLLFMIVPNAVVAVLTALITLAGGVFCPGMILAWFLGMSAMELFFFSFAVFIAMFTGHILVLPVFYAIFNCLFAALYWTVTNFISPYLYGMNANFSGLESFVTWLTPLLQLYTEIGVRTVYTEKVLADGSISYDLPIQDIAIGGGGILAAYAVAGVVLALLAYLVYRRRRSETAGDVVSVGWAKVLFRYGVAVTAAFTIGQGLYYLLFEYGALSGAVMELACMIVIATLGFLIAQMLLNKSFRVFKKSIRGSVLCAVLILAVFAAASLDVTGYTRRVPAADQVQSVSVDVSAYDYSSANLTERDSIEKVIAIHQYAVDHKQELQNINDWDYYYNGESMYARFWVNYTLKNGSVMSRSYTLPLERAELEKDGSLTAMVQDLVDTPEYKASDLLDTLYTGESGVELNGAMLYYYEDSLDVEQNRTLGKRDTQALYDALLEDAAAGRLPEMYLVSYPEDYEETHYVNYLEFEYRVVTENDMYNQYCCVYLTTNMTSTVAALEEMGVLNDRVKLMTQAEYSKRFDVYEDDAKSAAAELAEMDVPTTEAV